MADQWHTARVIPYEPGSQTWDLRLKTVLDGFAGAIMNYINMQKK